MFGTGGFLTLGSMIGFVTVFGITVRNSILIISHYEHLVESEGLSWGLAAAIKGELSPKFGDGLRAQAAAVWDCEAAGLVATSIPSVNLTP